MQNILLDSIVSEWESAGFFCKGPGGNTSGVLGHMVSFSATQLLHCVVKAATDDT